MRLIQILICSFSLVFFCMGTGPWESVDLTVKVTEHTPTLQELSIFYYGTTKYWSQIAVWNEITPPYSLKIGKKIKLLLKPKLDEEAGKLALLQMWRNILEKKPAAVLKNNDPISALEYTKDDLQWGAIKISDPTIASSSPVVPPPSITVIDPEGGMHETPVLAPVSPRPSLDEILATEVMEREKLDDYQMTGLDHLVKSEKLLLEICFKGTYF